MGPQMWYKTSNSIAIKVAGGKKQICQSKTTLPKGKATEVCTEVCRLMTDGKIPEGDAKKELVAKLTAASYRVTCKYENVPHRCEKACACAPRSAWSPTPAS